MSVVGTRSQPHRQKRALDGCEISLFVKPPSPGFLVPEKSQPGLGRWAPDCGIWESGVSPTPSTIYSPQCSPDKLGRKTRYHTLPVSSASSVKLLSYLQGFFCFVLNIFLCDLGSFSNFPEIH